VIGLEEQQRMGDRAVFLSAGGYHHHIALNTWESAGGSPPPPGATACTTWPCSTRTARRWRGRCGRVLDAGIELEGASDHGVSEALYLRDPDGNGVELYRDRDRAEWPRDAAGRLGHGHAPAGRAGAARRGARHPGSPGPPAD
jgi:catechol 2,3-dioxygenase